MQLYILRNKVLLIVNMKLSIAKKGESYVGIFSKCPSFL